MGGRLGEPLESVEAAKFGGVLKQIQRVSMPTEAIGGWPKVQRVSAGFGLPDVWGHLRG